MGFVGKMMGCIKVQLPHLIRQTTAGAVWRRRVENDAAKQDWVAVVS
jgi:hypothetical protein